jgi:hypothetical protein
MKTLHPLLVSKTSNDVVNMLFVALRKRTENIPRIPYSQSFIRIGYDLASPRRI